MRDYRKIEAWKKADDLTVSVYQVTREFPREERYGITSQIRRSAYSVPANIAEGSARQTKREYLQFLYIARGSLTETQYFVHLSNRLRYLKEPEFQELSEAIKLTFGNLHGLIKAVERESGKFTKAVALLFSAAVLCMSRLTISTSIPAT